MQFTKSHKTTSNTDAFAQNEQEFTKLNGHNKINPNLEERVASTLRHDDKTSAPTLNKKYNANLKNNAYLEEKWQKGAAKKWTDEFKSYLVSNKYLIETVESLGFNYVMAINNNSLTLNMALDLYAAAEKVCALTISNNYYNKNVISAITQKENDSGSTSMPIKERIERSEQVFKRHVCAAIFDDNDLHMYLKDVSPKKHEKLKMLHVALTNNITQENVQSYNYFKQLENKFELTKKDWLYFVESLNMIDTLQQKSSAFILSPPLINESLWGQIKYDNSERHNQEIIHPKIAEDASSKDKLEEEEIETIASAQFAGKSVKKYKRYGSVVIKVVSTNASVMFTNITSQAEHVQKRSIEHIRKIPNEISNLTTSLVSNIKKSKERLDPIKFFRKMKFQKTARSQAEARELNAISPAQQVLLENKNVTEIKPAVNTNNMQTKSQHNNNSTRLNFVGVKAAKNEVLHVPGSSLDI